MKLRELPAQRFEVQRSSSERGSALLIVFVFAAVLAVMLYREMPSVTFEAQRQKEQDLEDRGQEYVRAVQLFYRKNQRYPPSIEALEDTNRIRYLRQRFKDPFTGKEDWRLLHAGPGGMLIDSKVNRVPTIGKPATSSNSSFGNSSNSSFGNSSNSSFGNAAVPSSATSADTTAAGAPGTVAGGNSSSFGPSGAFGDSFSESGPSVVSMARQRSPAVSAEGSGIRSSLAPSSAALASDPTTPLVPSVDALPGSSDPGFGSAAANVAATPGQDSKGTGTAAGTTAMQAVGNLLQTPTLANTQSSTTGSGQLNSGGLAGVASKAKGRTVKKFGDQRDYSLWEFFYDPNQDTSMRASGASGPAGGAVNNPSQNANGASQNGTSNASFGTSNQSDFVAQPATPASNGSSPVNPANTDNSQPSTPNAGQPDLPHAGPPDSEPGPQ